VYFYPESGNFTDADGIEWVVTFTPFCDVNLTEFNEIVEYIVCTGSTSTCYRYGSNAAIAMHMVQTPLFGGTLTSIGPVCFAGSSSFSVGPQIQNIAEDEIGADPPPIALQPTDALVNFPMIAYTDAREPVVVPIEDPIVGTATATPEFVWSFAEGAAAHGPGLPYDGTSPTANPGYYVSYTYGSLGTPTIGLTVTWRVVFTMPGEPPVPLDDVIRENSATTTVRAAGSELIS